MQLAALEEWRSISKLLNEPTSSSLLDGLDGDRREVDQLPRCLPRLQSIGQVEDLQRREREREGGREGGGEGGEEEVCDGDCVVTHLPSHYSHLLVKSRPIKTLVSLHEREIQTFNDAHPTSTACSNVYQSTI